MINDHSSALTKYTNTYLRSRPITSRNRYWLNKILKVKINEDHVGLIDLRREVLASKDISDDTFSFLRDLAMVLLRMGLYLGDVDGNDDEEDEDDYD